MVLDHEGIISSANQATAAIIGLQPVEVINHPIAKFWKNAPTPWNPALLTL
jgi:PAS domain-containing protein